MILSWHWIQASSETYCMILGQLIILAIIIVTIIIIIVIIIIIKQTQVSPNQFQRPHDFLAVSAGALRLQPCFLACVDVAWHKCLLGCL